MWARKSPDSHTSDGAHAVKKTATSHAPFGQNFCGEQHEHGRAGLFFSILLRRRRHISAAKGAWEENGYRQRTMTRVKLNPTVCLSTQEAEFVALPEAVKEVRGAQGSLRATTHECFYVVQSPALVAIARQTRSLPPDIVTIRCTTSGPQCRWAECAHQSCQRTAA